ncbi:MAG: hypothetical protein EOM65_16740 [Synergistales bacterium]|nr:hypothetical protein [Synergistales bacterium]
MTTKKADRKMKKKWSRQFGRIHERLALALHGAYEAVEDCSDALGEFRESLSETELESQAKRLELLERKLSEMGCCLFEASDVLAPDINDIVWFNYSDGQLDEVS